MLRGPVGSLVLALLVGPVVRAQDETGKADLSPASVARYEKALAVAEPSVVAVVVSHRKYPEPGSAEPGRLGRYQPRHKARTGDPKLDLSEPANVPDNLCGSGVVVDAAGLVLTPYHLIEGATKIYVRTVTGAGCYADIHAADARSDLAVLRLLDPPGDLTAVRFATVRTPTSRNDPAATVNKLTPVIAVGHEAGGFAVGSPTALPVWIGNFGMSLPTTTTAREESRNRALYHYSVLMKTSDAGGLATSGGGLFNLSGELIGMSATLAAVSADGLAIPFDSSYRRIVDVLKAGREVEYGLLGVTLGGGPRQFPPPLPIEGRVDGVTLSGVTPGGPAGVAGLMAGDTITAIDGKRVPRQDDLFLHVGATPAGTAVRITYQRNQFGRGSVSRTTTATLDKMPHSFPWIASARPAPVFGLRVDYSSVMQVEKGFGSQGMPAGVMVRELVPGSPAEARFKGLGDASTRWLVTAVDGTPTPKPPAFYAATAGKKAVTLSLVDVDSGKSRQLTLPGN